jgi:hypothetical protein
MLPGSLQQRANTALLLLLLLISSLINCTEEPRLKARISRIKGSVEILSAGAKKRAAVGELLTAGNRIQTGPQSAVDLLLPGGSVIRIQQNSIFTLEELGARGQLRLDQGDLLLGISKLKAGESMQITTPTTVAAVRGTSFYVSTTRNSIAVLTGKVQVEKDGQRVVAESMREVRTDEDKLQPVKISRESARHLQEILEIEGVEHIEDFEEMQKVWASMNLNTDFEVPAVQKPELPAREVREK